MDIALRLEIMRRSVDHSSLREEFILNGLTPALTSLMRVLRVKIENFPICITKNGAPAQPMCANDQEMAPSECADWYEQHSIDVNVSYPRLEKFLAPRGAERRKAFQSHLLLASRQAAQGSTPREWMTHLTEYHEGAFQGSARILPIGSENRLTHLTR